jgi:hypothetical protein
MGENRSVYRVLMGNPEGQRPLGRPRRRCEDNIKMDLTGSGMRSIDWIDLVRDRYGWRTIVNPVMDIQVP